MGQRHAHRPLIVEKLMFLDPRPPIRAPRTAPAPLLSGGVTAPTIGLLANGFPDSAAFLDALREPLAHRFPGVAFVAISKPSPPTPLTPSQLDALTDGCDAVIAAYGH